MYTSHGSFRWIYAVAILSLVLSLAPVPVLSEGQVQTQAVPAQEIHNVFSDATGAPSVLPEKAPVAAHPPTPDVLPVQQTAAARENIAQSDATEVSFPVTQAEPTRPGSPLMFIENVGQFADGARFQVRGGEQTVWLAEDGLWVTVMEPVSPTLASFPLPPGGEREWEREDELCRGVNLKLSFPGANPHPRLEPFDRLSTHISYFIGSDPRQWRAGVPVWGGARYVELYPGVDLEVTGAGGGWTWRLVSRRSPSAIRRADVRLRVDGAGALALDDAGRLRVATTAGDLTLPLLQAVAADGKAIGPATTRPEVNGLEVASPFVPDFSVLGKSPSSPNDPSGLLYSTFLGGGDRDYGYGIAVDKEGNAYVTGETRSSDFPTTTLAFTTTKNYGADAFVVKVNTDGITLTYAAFLGGEDSDCGHGIAVDETGNA
jgi:hypothetical protein